VVTDTAGKLELAAGSDVDASSTTAGDIVLRGLGAITLTNVDTVDGKAVLSAMNGDQNISNAAEFQKGSFDNTTMDIDSVVLDTIQGWWDPSYRYRRPINVHNKDGADLEENFTALNLGSASLAYVGDNSFFGFTSPLQNGLPLEQ